MSEFKLLKQVRTLIEDEANGFIMSAHHCGTAACIAGWANNIVQDPDCWYSGELDLIDEGVTSSLFHTEQWPTSYQDAINKKAEALGFNPKEHIDGWDDITNYATAFLEPSDEGERFLRRLALALIDGVIANDGAMPADDFPLPSGVAV